MAANFKIGDKVIFRPNPFTEEKHYCKILDIITYTSTRKYLFIINPKNYNHNVSCYSNLLFKPNKAELLLYFD